jgi:hypothetical protein
MLIISSKKYNNPPFAYFYFGFSPMDHLWFDYWEEKGKAFRIFCGRLKKWDGNPRVG